MFDERKTAAALKEAWRTGGYRFIFINGILSVRADSWGFQAALTNVPAKVLGLITEHLGSILEDGSAFLLRKDCAEQSVMVAQEAEAWARIGEVLNNGALVSMKQTPLDYNGFEIWQEQKSLKVRMVDSGLTRIIDTDFRQDGMAEEDSLMILWKSMAGTVAYVMAEMDKDNGMERLDGYPWCGEGEQSASHPSAKN